MKGRGLYTGQVRAGACAGLAVIALLALYLLLLLPVAEASAPGSQPPDDFQAGTVLVKFKPMVVSILADGVLSFQGYKTLRSFNRTGVRQIAVTPGREHEVIASLKSNPLVEFAEPDYVRRPLWLPNDTYYSSDQWNLRKINMEEAWGITRGRREIKVAVIDTGLNMTHGDLPENIVSPLNKCTDTSSLSDDDGHGTHVSGIIAAKTNNGKGLAGVAPDISLMPIRVECDGTIFVSTEIEAIEYAADNGARVINISLGGPTWINSERAAVDYAMSKGALVVAAAGNEYETGNPASYPAGYPGVLAVAATASDDSHASYSQVQSYVGVAAPGGDGGLSSQWILSMYRTSGYARMAGTSQATPHVAGLAGLIWSVNPDLSNLQVASIITSTAVDLGADGRDDFFGWGRIDAFAALSKAKQTVETPTPTASPTVVTAATVTPAATVAPTLTATPAATSTSTPMATVPASVTPTATPSPTSTAAPAPSPTASPTASPIPTATSVPTPVPTLAPTPVASETPVPNLSALSRRAYLPGLTRDSFGW